MHVVAFAFLQPYMSRAPCFLTLDSAVQHGCYLVAVVVVAAILIVLRVRDRVLVGKSAGCVRV